MDWDRRERHCLHLFQEDEGWPLIEVFPSGVPGTDGVGESGFVVRKVVEEVLGVEEECGVVDGVSEHGAKRVRVGTELGVNNISRYICMVCAKFTNLV